MKKFTVEVYVSGDKNRTHKIQELAETREEAEEKAVSQGWLVVERLPAAAAGN